MKIPFSSPRLTALLAAGLTATALTACGGDDTVAPGPLASISVTPNTTLAINATQQFVAIGKDAAGNVVSISPTWSVESGGGAINTDGLFTAGTALGVFTSTVKATSGAISGTASVTVTVGSLASIAITPSPDTLAISATQQFVAAGKDAGGNTVAITPTWSLAAGGGAISASGLFTAGTVPGAFPSTVTATSGSITSTASVVVVAGSLASIVVTPSSGTFVVNGQQQYTAVGKDAGNNVIAITPVWSVVASGGAISASGLFTAGTTPGVFTNTVKATSGAISGTATVTVTVGALASITVTPSSATFVINGQQQYTAVGKDAGNNVIAITPTWSVVASGGAINGTGLFTAGTTPGIYTNTVKATSGAISGTATVTVTAGGLATIAVTPNPFSLASTLTQQYTAVGKDAGNNVVAITPVWSVVAGGGTISAGGLFTAGGVVGTFTNSVKATSGAVSGTATVTVTAAGPHGPAAVNLGSAGNYVILAKSAISNVPTSDITGDLGISPAAASFITGFALNLVAASPFSTSSQVTGNIYAPGYADPTPANLTTAIGDMQTAYTDAAGRVTPDFTELGSGEIGGLTLVPGLYKWSTTVSISTDVTLNGSPTDVWIFQIAGGITQASATTVHLTGGALAKNVFWQSFGVVDINTTAHMEGIILSQTSITLHTGASANGQLLAQTAVALAGNIVVKK